MTARAAARACANIAFVKYWGNIDAHLRLPFNDSVSMNLDSATTTTVVNADGHLDRDEVIVDGVALAGSALERAVRHLELIRARAGAQVRARVQSTNTFPMGTGVASSASGYAALTLAAASAYGLELGEAELSALARRGSGSAARSVPDGFAWWRSGTSDQSSHAFSLAGRDHWDLRDVVAIVSLEHKELGSGSGHAAALSSSVFPARLRELPARLTAVREAILTRDLEALGPLIEEEALSLHAVALTSRPPILYWTGQTVEILRLVRRWRAGGLAVYFTLDAGPNVHLICVGRDAETVAELLADLPFVQRTIVCAPGGPAALVDP